MPRRCLRLVTERRLVPLVGLVGGPELIELALGTRILVENQLEPAHNGVVLMKLQRCVAVLEDAGAVPAEPAGNSHIDLVPGCISRDGSAVEAVNRLVRRVVELPESVAEPRRALRQRGSAERRIEADAPGDVVAAERCRAPGSETR